MYRLPSPETLAEIRRLYWAEELSLQQVGWRIGKDATVIRQWMRAANIPRRKPLDTVHTRSLKRQKELTPQILELYESGLSVQKVAARLEIGRKAIDAVLNRNAIKRHEYKRRFVTNKGYVNIRKPEHPRAHMGYVREHILIWEEVHNQSLPKGWSIHHLNGIKIDNRPENLLAMPEKKHAQYIPALKKRIRELEAKNKLLERALDTGQMLFTIGDN